MGDHQLATLPMLPSSGDTAPAAPVQQNDPRYPAPIKQDRPSGPDQRRTATKAAENQQAVDTCTQIEKAADDRRHAEYLAFKEEIGRNRLPRRPKHQQAVDARKVKEETRADGRTKN